MSANTIRALSVLQPWASMIASGAKTIETRSWRVSYRGPLLICAGKSLRLLSPLFNRAEAAGVYPTRCAVCLCNLVDCRPMRDDDRIAAGCYVYPGAFAWVLDDIRPCPHVPVVGRQGLFVLPTPPEIQRMLAAPDRCAPQQ